MKNTSVISVYSLVLFISVIIFLMLILSGCDPGINRSIQGESASRKWTILIYMAADNDLEAAAISDFNELEAVNYGNAPVTVLVLLDRSPDNDTSNGDWSDTRMFEVKSNPSHYSSALVSKRLDCPELGLSKTTETELDTSNPLVLSRAIDFAKRVYPAEHYALFIWGHGTGWRSSSGGSLGPSPSKAFAFDDTSGSYMTLPDLGRAVAGKDISVIGFDTCFASLLEVVYQVREDCELFVGSESAILSTGWDYTTLFTDFLKKPDLSVSDLGNSIQYQFSRQYAGSNDIVISQIRTRYVDDLFAKFEEFAGAVADAIITPQERDLVLSQILNETENYYFTIFPCDLYADIFDLSVKISDIRSGISDDADIQSRIADTAANLQQAICTAVVSSWSKNGASGRLGVYVTPLQGIKIPAAAHAPEYFRGSAAMNKSAFVENSQHWVPNSVPQSSSLLDKLFYWKY